MSDPSLAHDFVMSLWPPARLVAIGLALFETNSCQQPCLSAWRRPIEGFGQFGPKPARDLVLAALKNRPEVDIHTYPFFQRNLG
jgi:hypothetical protein